MQAASAKLLVKSTDALMKTALLVGGTAATGVSIAAELQTRGYDVTIYHTGRHEVAELDHLEHIHGNPHFTASITQDLAGRSWDVTVATYGRTRFIAEALRGRTGHFVSISGMPVVGAAVGVPVTEAAPYEGVANAPTGLRGLLPRIIETEQAVLGWNADGSLPSTIVRYPYVYGPYSVVPMEWHVIRRVLDGRQRFALPGAGLMLRGRCASPNAARLIGAVIDNPHRAMGEIYHAADSQQLSMREWVEAIAGCLGHRFEFVEIPSSIVPLTSSAVPMAGEFTWARSPDVSSGRLRHELVSNQKARTELGYADVAQPHAWIDKTVRFWLANPPVVDGAAGRLKPEEFDYEAEDALLSYWDSIVMTRPDFGREVTRGHAYEHPKAAAAVEG